MKVILFGASGMVGQGVLRECLRDDGVERVLVVGRSALGGEHAKLRELVHADFTDFAPVADQLAGYDACFFCLGVSAAGMSEADYTRVTYDYTLAAARVIAERNDRPTFIYVSGEGTDSTEKARSMWARVKGKTENALLALPLKAVMFRPGLIRPRHGVKSKTRLYRIFYAVAWPLYPLLSLGKNLLTDSEKVGRAMIKVARDGAPKPILTNRDINAIARQEQTP